ncbi:acetyl esterase/lipase [Prosthecobacter fusiformis]|uniref:Acetyl esterase/lipase n=1 Tax=Prosthecobacter fusiformis TaxID=48464 RepID=A0A4V3FIB8_9BACT|nr:alpha/beta hydrolase [Prosthecobacter fusiformis]TDU81853.1 acetyl esterase/lipase [Prosthecobacter fusiformis]
MSRFPSLFRLAVLFLASAVHAAEPAKVPLWPDGAPGAKGQEDKDQPFIYAWPAAKETATKAAFIVCPGGGYGGLAADHEGVQVARWFNGIGVSAFVLHYRLGTQGYHYPIQLMDVQRAIRHVRANAAQYGIDPNRIGVIGFSAGGHLSSMAATLFDEKPEGMTNDAVDQVSARPDVAAPTYAVISMIDDFAHMGSRKNLLGPNDSDELARKVSTHLRVTPQTPPTFLFQTDEDTVVPAENAVNFYLACRKNGVPAELHCYKPGPHGVGLYLGDPVLGTWSGHLRDWLRNQGFLNPAERAAVTGKLTVNGKPVSWGNVVFSAEDPSAPVAGVRVRGGNFKLDAKAGPVVGKIKLRVSYSAADVPGLDTPDGTVTATEQKAGSGEWTVEIKPGDNKLDLNVER